ncbi:transposase [Corynebacterium striatum]|nr:transposase [Corynebacterium striatum]PIS59917.1 transposase [Corynebacterium striatum]PIS66042.1 transposase [Corynebacterium striatum]
MKTLWLMICNIEDRRAARRAKEGAKASASAKQPIEGSKTSNWKQAINQLSVAYPDRFAAYL